MHRNIHPVLVPAADRVKTNFTLCLIRFNELLNLSVVVSMWCVDNNRTLSTYFHDATLLVVYALYSYRFLLSC